MKFYFVGLDLRSASHDYRSVEKALKALHGRKVSPRIWLCVASKHRRDALADVYRGLAQNDQMMVVEVPSTMRLPQTLPMAA